MLVFEETGNKPPVREKHLKCDYLTQLFSDTTVLPRSRA